MAHRLACLRQLLTANRLAAYVLPRTDEHQSQYLTQRDERVKYLSGFSGSNALAVVSETQALLWTDSRYFIQAQKQLSKGWQLRKMLPKQPKWFQVMAKGYPKSARVGFDPTLLTAKTAIQRVKSFGEAGIEFIPVAENLVDRIWEDRPMTDRPQIYLHEEWAGRTMSEKVKWIRRQITQNKAKAAIFNDLSEIAWVLNLRSSQLPHTPFFKGILVITMDGGRLYLPQNHPSLSNAAIKAHLSAQNIMLQSKEPQFEEQSLVVMDSINYYIYSKIKDTKFIVWGGIGQYRAIRTQKQIQGFRRCHLVDGIALAKFWAWRSARHTLTQYEAAQMIDSLRKQQPFNMGLSFDTISAGGPNGAIVHYRPSPDSSAVITNDMVHLVDSGGQYLDGTTDVTRAFHFGNPSQHERQAYTRVLMGNLDIERLRWPEGSLSGSDIDVLARRHLWSKGWDYLHGTGHGVGYFASVHQMPVGISKLSSTKFKAGMVVTNEPGYYCQGKFGIRIENMLIVQQYNGFNLFQNLTLCPYDRNLIDVALLDEQTIRFIDRYHWRVMNTLGPHLQSDPSTLAWLQRATRPLNRN